MKTIKIAAILLLLVTTAPAWLSSLAWAANAPALPSRALPVPIVPQATDYSCGAASLLSVLYYWQAYEGRETELYADLQTTQKDGTRPEKIVDVAREYGLTAELKQNLTLNDLLQALWIGDTVILDIQAWPDDKAKNVGWKDRWDDGHYVVLVAMDESYLYIMDPSVEAAYGFIAISEFLDRWHDRDGDKNGYTLYQNLGIFIHGRAPRANFPDRLVPVN